MTDYNLSVSDLVLVDGFKEAYARIDNETIKLFLHRNGLDTEQDYELVQVTHRNLRNQVVNGQRYEGSERLDDEWIKSGYASLEARIEAVEDPSLRRTLRAMKAQRTQETVFD